MRNPLGALGLTVAVCAALYAAPVSADRLDPAPGVSRPAPIEVTVVDRTYGHWNGLREAVAGWNHSPLVHLVIRPKCPDRRPCVVVQAFWYNEAAWSGITIPQSPVETLIRLDIPDLDHVPWWRTVSVQTAVMCHELGHALGLAHPRSLPLTPAGQTGCMEARDPALMTPVASPDDLYALAQVPVTGGIGWGVLGHR